MGSESIAQEAEGRMGYGLRGNEGERDNCFSKIQLVGQNYRDKLTLNFNHFFFPGKLPALLAISGLEHIA